MPYIYFAESFSSAFSTGSHRSVPSVRGTGPGVTAVNPFTVFSFLLPRETLTLQVFQFHTFDPSRPVRPRKIYIRVPLLAGRNSPLGRTPASRPLFARRPYKLKPPRQMFPTTGLVVENVFVFHSGKGSEVIVVTRLHTHISASYRPHNGMLAVIN